MFTCICTSCKRNAIKTFLEERKVFLNLDFAILYLPNQEGESKILTGVENVVPASVLNHHIVYIAH